MTKNHPLPQSINEAVDYLLADISLNHEIQIPLMKKEGLLELHFSLGTHIRNEFGLWKGNMALMESCRSASGKNEIDADDASMLIIEALWEKLRSRAR